MLLVWQRMVEDYNMTTTPNQQYLRIYLATWDHEHGQDISAHTTNGELTGYSEFFNVDSLSLNEDEPCEKEKWIADTSHIGA